MSAYSCGAVALADGAAEEALAAARRAAEAWHELGAPYEVARSRVLIGLACRSLGDADTGALELEAARAVFAGLDALHDVERVDSLAPTPGRAGAHGLTRREIEVLRLVASGKTNRQIASALVISERTVARHVQNIFAKLRVRSRTAASAFAFEHDIL
jgi:DNA-binding CsgD family transcriptional regulator